MCSANKQCTANDLAEKYLEIASSLYQPPFDARKVATMSEIERQTLIFKLMLDAHYISRGHR